MCGQWWTSTPRGAALIATMTSCLRHRHHHHPTLLPGGDAIHVSYVGRSENHRQQQMKMKIVTLVIIRLHNISGVHDVMRLCTVPYNVNDMIIPPGGFFTIGM